MRVNEEFSPVLKIEAHCLLLLSKSVEPGSECIKVFEIYIGYALNCTLVKATESGKTINEQSIISCLAKHSLICTIYIVHIYNERAIVFFGNPGWSQWQALVDSALY